jgi:hypothetical protein
MIRVDLNVFFKGSMWRFGFNVSVNYNDMSNYCGGKDNQWSSQNGLCGLCGDPYQGEHISFFSFY